MKPTGQELSTINSRLPGSTLSASAVEILPFRVFDNQVTDRYTIMTPEMMKKVAKDLDDGYVAFNKLHESRYSLPIGRSVEAKIVQDGNNFEVQAKMYAVLQNPDGSAFPEGQDLANRYNTGAVFACSAGVSVGFYKCTVCGNDIRDYRKCEHMPGSTYLVDEKPIVCYALMTGKDIQDGMAMDCSIYEVSAVTAGGVRRASVLTETFGKYNTEFSAEALQDFKKEQFENKDIQEHIYMSPLKIDQFKQEESTMADLKIEEVVAKNYELIADKAKVEAAHATLQGEFGTLKAQYDQLVLASAKTTEEFTALTAESVTLKAQVEEFTTTIATLTADATTAKEEFTTQLAAAEAKAVDADAFKAAYIAVVTADGVKIAADATTDYASKSVADLATLHTEYLTKIAAIPSGQHSLTGDDDETKPAVSNVFEAIPAAFFKTN